MGKRLKNSVVAMLTIVPTATAARMMLDSPQAHPHSPTHASTQNSHTKHASSRWTMYVEADNVANEYPGQKTAVTGKLVLVPPEGSHKEDYYNVLPLRDHPIDKEWCHSTGFGSKKAHAAPDAQFFIPLSNSHITDRTDLGIHPIRTLKGGTLAGTQGCIGIMDGDSADFQAIWKELVRQHIQPKMLDVHPVALAVLTRHHKEHPGHPHPLHYHQPKDGHSR